MNSTMWSYFFVMVGILGIVLINIFSDILIANEQDYFLLKETTEAAMIDAVDNVAYSKGLDPNQTYDPELIKCEAGQPLTVRIEKDRFIESFLMRFSRAISLRKTYEINIMDIQECPPKVTVAIKAKDKYSFIEFFRVSYDSGEQIVNKVTGILETKPFETIK